VRNSKHTQTEVCLQKSASIHVSDYRRVAERHAGASIAAVRR